jgi:hypothetical protein
MSSATSLRRKAAEVRDLARATHDPAIRCQLNDIADHFERLALRAGGPSMPSASPSALEAGPERGCAD